MLGVRDIVNDLGVASVTVWSWIRHGKIKATMENRRIGWKIDKADYEAFLNQNPKWRMVHDGEIYKTGELKAREDVLMALSARIISTKMMVNSETRNDEYMKGFNRAISDIQNAINREMCKKVPDSRSEQMA